LRLGIFGGAFNPPHIGHLVLAQEAHGALGLDRVVFVPVGTAPHREVELDPGPEARLEMCELAIAGEPRFEASRIELDRPGPSYTADTLRTMREQSPGHELVLLLGADQATALPDWHEPEEVLRNALLGVAERAGQDASREGVERALAGLAGGERVEFFDMPRIDVSASMVRRRAGEGRPLRFLVPDAVAGYIAEHGLYGASVAAGSR
jgi:nicotinate-nucleotide adenylyltransferase